MKFVDMIVPLRALMSLMCSHDPCCGVVLGSVLVGVDLGVDPALGVA